MQNFITHFRSPFSTVLDRQHAGSSGEHRIDVSAEEIAYMEKALALVAEQKFAGKFPKWIFDHQMRQIPDHYHFHVRPLLW
jgi:hypothetical protein